MKQFISLVYMCIAAVSLYAQSNELIYVKLDKWAKDERFDKLQIVTPFYFVQNDTIETLDFESMRESKKIRITKPDGFKSYAYGYLFFAGVPNLQNPGYVNMLMVDLAERVPKLFIDRNNNYNFTDDGPAINVPMPFNRKEAVLIELARTENANATIAVLLSRMDYSNKYSYKNLLNEYYELYYKDRKFCGVEYCFREQRYTAREGIVRLSDDSFRIALQDVNSNGWYNEAETDKIITANYPDTVFDSKDELRAMTVAKDKSQWRFEKNGKIFEIIQIDPAGRYLTLREIQEVGTNNRLSISKKAPNFIYFDWKGNRTKLKQLKKYNVYIYYTGPYAKNFSADTATLRVIADEFKDCVKVIGFIDVNKSYELNIFGTYSNLNWTAAYKNKYVTQKLKIRGIPSSLWLGKRRKVKQYNLTPQEFLETLRKIQRG
ncbi:MAG: hypothetical protein V4590_10030 [Bacteroidota bacterium]